MDYELPSGLKVTDRRHTRSLIPRDSDLTPAIPNDNPAVGTVGPNVPAVIDAPSHVMYPAAHAGMPYVQPWAGWPTEWATPNWGAAAGLAEMLNRVSTVFGAIDLNANILATMTPYRMQGAKVIDQLPWFTNPQPEVYTGWIEAMKQAVTSYMGGEAFIWATSRYADNSVRSWVVLNPAWVEVEQHGQVRSYTMGGLDVTADILHIRYASWPGDPHGHGPLEALANNLFGAAALERYQANLATRGGIPWAVLTAPGNLSSPQAVEMRDSFVQSRLSAMGAPAVLSGGVTLTPMTISPKDFALLELRQFDESRIAVLLGVPPTLLGLPSGADSLTYSTTESIYDFHWRSSLRPKASTIMEAISNWALVNGQRIEVNRDEYVRPAFGERITGWSTLFNIIDPATGQRAVTIDEIRAAERLDALSIRSVPVGVR